MRSPVVIEQGVRFTFEFGFSVDTTSEPVSHDDDPALTPNLARVML